MVQTVYTSARDVDVRTCAPQPLIRSNFLAEFRTEADKARARRNLGINEENDLFWGNIQGFIELQKDLVEYIKGNFEYSVETQEGITTIQEALDFIFEIIEDYTSHKEDYLKLDERVTATEEGLKSLQESLEKVEEDFQKAIEAKEKDITELSEALESFKKDVESFEKTITEQLESLNNTVGGFDERISNIEETFDGALLYNTTLNDNIKAPNKVGGIEAGTKVSDLKGKSIIDIVDILVFPSVVPTLNEPYAYYSTSNQTIQVGDSITTTLNFYQGDAGEIIAKSEIITLNDVKVSDFSGYTELGTYKRIGTITYEAGEYLVDDRGNQTSTRVEAGSVTATLTIITTYPWYINSNKQQLVPFNQASGEISFNIGGTPAIKLPGANSKINSFYVDGGSGFLEVNLAGWEETTNDIDGIPYKVWTKKTAYVDSLPHKINFTLLA